MCAEAKNDSLESQMWKKKGWNTLTLTDTKPAASRSETLSQAQQGVHTEQSKAKYTVQRYDSTSASLINFPFQSENDFFFFNALEHLQVSCVRNYPINVAVIQVGLLNAFIYLLSPLSHHVVY